MMDDESGDWRVDGADGEREIDVQPHALRGRVQSSRQQIYIMRPRHIATDGLMWSVC